jgi:hypothetical protein
LNFAELCLKKKFDSDILKFENYVNYVQKYNLQTRQFVQFSGQLADILFWYEDDLLELK